MQEADNYKKALALEKMGDFQEAIKIIESLLSQPYSNKDLLLLFLRRLYIKSSTISEAKYKLPLQLIAEQTSDLTSNTTHSNLLFQYLAINDDLFSLIHEKDTFEQIKKKLQLHYDNFGKEESRVTTIATLTRLLFKDEGVKALDSFKKHQYVLYDNELRAYISSGKTISIPSDEDMPLISVIIVLYNKAPLTFACLKSLSSCLNCCLELIIIDNNSTDRTDILLKSLKGKIQITKNSSNSHFLEACNQGIKLASGEYIALVNNDTILNPLIFKNALATYENNKDYSPIIGGMVQHLDGRLQEAGSLILEDGSPMGIGRRDDSTNYKYNFQRNVHYVSGCFLFTHKKVIKALKGFDTYFKPAYFEETDLCLRHLKRGGAVLYEPRCKLTHFEFGSNDKNSNTNASKLMKKNKVKFTNKHIDWIRKNGLKDKSKACDTHVSSLISKSHQKKILIIDDCYPFASKGSGHSRFASILSLVVESYSHITLYETDGSTHLDYLRRECESKSEVINCCDMSLYLLLASRIDYYDKFVISRKHNQERFIEAINMLPLPNAERIINKSIIDIESLFSLRDFTKDYLLKGNKIFDPSENNPLLDKLIGEELSIFKSFKNFMTVSEYEKKLIQKNLDSKLINIEVIGHGITTTPNVPDFENRNICVGFLGGFNNFDSPNIDSIKWLKEEVYPYLNHSLCSNSQIQIAGSSGCNKCLNFLQQFLGDQYIGQLNSLEKWFNSLKVFVVPTRYAAGAAHKLHMASSYGVPIVTTTLIAKQMNLVEKNLVLHSNNPRKFADSVNLLLSDKDTWIEYSNKSYQIALTQCDVNKFKNSVEQILMM